MKTPLILDGGMGRELNRIGAPFRQPEWSALALIEAPEFVRRAHDAFIASGAQAPIPERSDVTALRPAVGRDRPHLERILELRKSGAVRAPEVQLFDLAKASDALRVSAGRHLRGKLVLKVR